MNNATAWFARNYSGVAVTRIMIIPTKRVTRAGGFNEEVLILRKRGLEQLISRVRRFFDGFAELDLKDLSEKGVQRMLDAQQLGIDELKELLEAPRTL